MKTGKLTPQELNDIVFAHLPPLNEVVLVGPGNGLDCAVLECPPEAKLIVSTDPITGADQNIGSLAVHVACNDLAAFGVKTEALMLVLIAPPTATRGQLTEIMQQVASACKELGTSIAGGHTEISDAVNRFLLSMTAVGYRSGELITSNGAKVGDSLIMTKSAGLEGTSIIASDFTDRLDYVLSQDELEEAKQMLEQISVVAEGLIGGRLQVHAMHDVTEGGVLGAGWEMAQAASLGLVINYDSIPVHPLTKKICDHLQLDPYRLISSGSMLIATDKPEKLLEKLASINIKATEIGYFTDDKKKLYIRAGKQIELTQPERDELYKIV